MRAVLTLRSAGIALGLLLLVGAAWALFACMLAPRENVLAWLALLAASSPLLVGAGALLVRARLDARRFALYAMLGALALRIGPLLAPVSLSDDVHRYAWDGALVADGRDPYASRPREVVGTLPELDRSALSRLNSPDYYTVYPPLAQGVFAIAAAIASSLGVAAQSVLRLFFVLFDLATVAALLAIAGAQRRAWALVYAFCPLVAWEIAAGAHTEALMTPLLVLGLLMLDRDHRLGAFSLQNDRKPLAAGLLFGLAASAKLTALVLVPVTLAYLLRREKRSAWVFSLAGGGVLLAGFVPFASAHLMPNLSQSLALYARTFSFNAPIYYGARWLLGYRQDWNEPPDALLVPLLGLCTVAWLLFLSLRQDGSRDRLLAGAAHAYLGYLLLSRVVHPWYVLPALAFGVLAKDRPIVLLAFLLPLSYLRYGALDHESPLVIAAQFVPFALAVLLSFMDRGRSKTKARCELQGLLRRSRSGTKRHRRGDPARLSASRSQVPPRREQGAQCGGALQDGAGGLRSPEGSG